MRKSTWRSPWLASGGVLATAIVVVALTATYSEAANPPLASSYKSVSTVAVSPDPSHTCPSGWVPLKASGNGNDQFDSFTLSEHFCFNPANLVFAGSFTVLHASGDAFSGRFNGQFVPNGQVLEAHAAWRVINGNGRFLHATGAGTGKGVGTVINGAPGPATIFLDGSMFLPSY
jgi:hypothetical protein